MKSMKNVRILQGLGLFALGLGVGVFAGRRQVRSSVKRDAADEARESLGHAAEPDQRLHGESHDLSKDEQVDLTSFDSFPSSDPPGNY